MLNLILSSLYFMLPAYTANAMPVIAKHLKIFPSLAYPIDCMKTLKGKPILGKSKTIRGFVVGIFAALIIGILQYFIAGNEFIKSISLINYTFNKTLLLSLLLGFGALIGDLVKSFLKRRINIKSGDPWIIADQIDYAIGALIFASFINIPLLPNIIVIIIISPLLALAANIISYLTGMKKVWW